MVPSTQNPNYPPAPRRIPGSAGSRIRVILGETGDDYLYYFDEDDGDTEWQSCDWTVNGGGPPYGLCRQMNNMFGKGRHITSVDFDCTGQWFVAGEKRDGTGAHSWWGGTEYSDEIKKFSSTGKVYFGGTTHYGSSISVVMDGRNRCFISGNVDGSLYRRLKRINSRNKSVDFIRCFNANGPGYFISDDEGTEWESVGTHLSNELKNGGGQIYDVAMAKDGSWIVIRQDKFVSSNGVSSDLTNKLQEFYSNHKHRQTKRRDQIVAHQQTCAEIDRIHAERRARAAEAARLEAEKKAKTESLKRKCDDIDNLRQIQAKRLRTSQRVTAIGFSSEPGDAMVKRINQEDGSIEVVKAGSFSHEEDSVVIKDPRLLTHFNDDDSDTVESLSLLCYASDKYEAAISMFHCACHNGLCYCTRVGFAISINASAQIPPPRPILKDECSPSYCDEYRCFERIDMRRLNQIEADLERDSVSRAHWLEKLQLSSAMNNDDAIKKLQRCHVLEAVVKSLAARLKDQPVDDKGCVTYEVKYEHRDLSGRGRLFAIGETVKVSDSKFPRTTTLQGMHSDLRSALVGKFAYDIDCANSEIRLICSLAQQLDKTYLIRHVFDYRDRRDQWLDKIEQAHGVDRSTAKRLVNIIASGGAYQDWLRQIKKKWQSDGDIKDFCFKLRLEIDALRDQLVQHPKFKWTELEREKMKREEKPLSQIERNLMPRIIQSCENDVLGIIHRTFAQNKWFVRAKVFDGLIVEPSPDTSLDLSEMNQKCEAACRYFGWDVKLVEKPLHGMTEQPSSIEEARAVVRSLVDGRTEFSGVSF